MNRVLAAAIALFILVLAPTLSATPSSHVLILHMQNEADPDPAVHRIPLRHGSTFVTDDAEALTTATLVTDATADPTTSIDPAA